MSTNAKTSLIFKITRTFSLHLVGFFFSPLLSSFILLPVPTLPLLSCRVCLSFHPPPRTLWHWQTDPADRCIGDRLGRMKSFPLKPPGEPVRSTILVPFLPSVLNSSSLFPFSPFLFLFKQQAPPCFVSVKLKLLSFHLYLTSSLYTSPCNLTLDLHSAPNFPAWPNYKQLSF